MMNMHNNSKVRKIVCAVIVIILCVAMVLPIALSALV
jgi:hypothetical protein